MAYYADVEDAESAIASVEPSDEGRIKFSVQALRWLGVDDALFDLGRMCGVDVSIPYVRKGLLYFTYHVVVEGLSGKLKIFTKGIRTMEELN